MTNYTNMQNVFPDKVDNSTYKNINTIGILNHVKVKEIKYAEGPQEITIEHEVQRAVINAKTDAEVLKELNFETKRIEPKLVAVDYSVSQHLLHDSATIDTEIIAEHGYRALALAVEDEMLRSGLAVGNADHFQAIAKVADVEVKDVTFTGKTLEDGSDIGMLDEEDVALAVRAVSTGFTSTAQPTIVFANSVQSVMNPFGASSIVYDNENARTLGKVTHFNELDVNNKGTKTAGIVFHPDAYLVAVSPARFEEIADGKTAMRGEKRFKVSAYMDGIVVNPKAVKVLGYSEVLDVTQQPTEEPTA